MEGVVVVESDWPEYEIVWKMIQDRVEGRPNEITTLRAQLAEARAQIKAAEEQEAYGGLNEQEDYFTRRWDVSKHWNIAKAVFTRPIPAHNEREIMARALEAVLILTNTRKEQSRNHLVRSAIEVLACDFRQLAAKYRTENGEGE